LHSCPASEVLEHSVLADRGRVEVALCEIDAVLEEVLGPDAKRSRALLDQMRSWSTPASGRLTKGLVVHPFELRSEGGPVWLATLGHVVVLDNELPQRKRERLRGKASTSHD